jgi:arylsulfatase A-like enzyme
VLLVTIDMLRADRLGAAMPALDALEADSVVFEAGRSTTSWTLPALASLMTSSYPATHRATQMTSVLDGSFTTLAERLGAAGYATRGIASHVFLKDRFGLSQGFEDYDASLAKSMARSAELVSSPAVTRHALDWLDQRPEADQRPFLLWVHYFDPHADYLVHGGDGGAQGTEPERYRGEVRFTDAWLGRLLAGLRERGLSDNTVVVVVADHGEEFGDHGATRHGHTLYEELVRVPLVIHVPRAAGPFAGRLSSLRLTTPVSLLDVEPTLLELCDVGVDPTSLAGSSLVPLMLGQPFPERPILSEVSLRDGRHMDALVLGEWKLIVHRDGTRESELY